VTAAIAFPRHAIEGAPLEVRPWRVTDAALLSDAERALSAASLTARFFTGTSTFPPAYVRRLMSGPGQSWDATVAIDGGALVGWAEWGRRPDDPRTAELGVLVVDAWQHRGVGGRLMRALLPRAIRSGIRVLNVDIENSNVSALRAVHSLFGDITPDSVDGDVLHFVVPLIHPVGG